MTRATHVGSQGKPKRHHSATVWLSSDFWACTRVYPGDINRAIGGKALEPEGKRRGRAFSRHQTPLSAEIRFGRREDPIGLSTRTYRLYIAGRGSLFCSSSLWT